MLSKQVIFSLALVATIATFAYFDTATSFSKPASFLSLPLNKADKEFIEFIGKFKRNYKTADEYESRRKIFE